MYQHHSGADQLALGTYEALQRWVDPSASDEERHEAFTAVMEARCDHGDALLRRAITAVVENAIEQALEDVIASDPLAGSSFHEPLSEEGVDRCLFCGCAGIAHADVCPTRPLWWH